MYKDDVILYTRVFRCLPIFDKLHYMSIHFLKCSPPHDVLNINFNVLCFVTKTYMMNHRFFSISITYTSLIGDKYLFIL